jgi:hypothetical protein
VIVGSWSIGAAFSFSPNFQKGLIAAGRIFALLRRVPEVKNASQPLHLHHSDVRSIVQQYFVDIQNLFYNRMKIADITDS